MKCRWQRTSRGWEIFLGRTNPFGTIWYEGDFSLRPMKFLRYLQTEGYL